MDDLLLTMEVLQDDFQSEEPDATQGGSEQHDENANSGNGQDEEMRLQPEGTNKNGASDNEVSGNGQDEEMRLQPEGTNKNAEVSSAGDNEASGNGQDEELRLQPEATNKDANLPSADDNGASANGQDEEMRLQPEGTNKNAAGDNEANGNGQDEEMRLQPEGTNKNAGDVPTGAGDNINEISGNGQDEEMRLQPEATGKNSAGDKGVIIGGSGQDGEMHLQPEATNKNANLPSAGSDGSGVDAHLQDLPTNLAGEVINAQGSAMTKSAGNGPDDQLSNNGQFDHTGTRNDSGSKAPQERARPQRRRGASSRSIQSRLTTVRQVFVRLLRLQS